MSLNSLREWMLWAVLCCGASETWTDPALRESSAKQERSVVGCERMDSEDDSKAVSLK